MRAPGAATTISLAALVVGALLALAPSAGTTPKAWTLRVAVSFGSSPVDPALGQQGPLGGDLVCANLYHTSDAGGAHGGHVVPEVASGPPRISAHGRRYTFTIRRGFRFAKTGAPVRAASFAAAIDRVLDPRMRSAGAIWVQDVVGADRVQAGQAKTASGIRYHGDALVITLKKPASDLPARLALVFFCSIPVNTPHDPNGVTPPTAGPYYVSHLDANTEVLRRNPYYRGHRPRHPANIVYKFSQPLNAIPLEIERGEVDTGVVLFVPEADAEQYPKLFHVATGIIVTCLALNNDRPLFKNNLRLRKAVNYAIDRKALDQQFGYPPLRPTDQYLAAAMPGFNDARIYPFKPNLKKARALARGHLGSGQAIMYYRNSSPTALARARIVQYDLSRIGLSVELKGPTGGAAGNRGEPFDIVDIGCVFPGYVDPFAILGPSFDGRTIKATGNTDVAYFNDRKFNRRLAAASRLSGRARYGAFGKLDVDLARDGAPAVAYGMVRQTAFVSPRIGCVRLNPLQGLVFGALCLKRP
jgi:peptide/nickel transport system substrate-binding protein